MKLFHESRLAKALKIFFLAFIVFLLFSQITYGQIKSKVDKKLIEKLNQTSFVDAIIILKEDYNYYLINEKKEKQNIDLMRKNIKKMQNEIILKTNEKEFIIQYKYDNFPALSGKISIFGIKNLEDNYLVQGIYYPSEFKTLLTDSSSVVKVDEVQLYKVNDIHIKGKGESACIIDSGIDYTHSALGECTQTQFISGNCSKITGGYDFASNDNNPNDGSGHGTHVAGIIAGNGSIKGIAPESKLIIVKIVNDSAQYNSTIFEQHLMAGIDYCINHNVTVISMSLGKLGWVYSNPFFCDDNESFPSYIALKSAKDKGIINVAASGNYGRIDGISYPACSSAVISVGATDKNDNVANFTNAYSILNLLAPGVKIRSSLSSMNPINPACSDVIEDTIICNGTSMAAPHVSGAVLLLQQYHNLSYGRKLSPDEILTSLKLSGVPIIDNRFSDLTTFPRIDIAAAIAFVTIYPVKVTPTIISGSLRANQSWYTKLNVTDMERYNLIVEQREFNSNHKTEIILILPNGSNYTANFPAGKINLSWSSLPQGNNWTIKVFGKDIPSGNDSKFKLNVYKQLTGKPEDQPGGINFTRAELDYVSTCDPSNGLVAVMKGVEANVSAGDTIVNITNATVMAADAFLAGLVIPDDRVWVTLDTEPINGRPWFKGDVSRVDSTFARTWAAKVMFDADLQLKMDTLAKSQPMMQTLIYDWIDTVSRNANVVPSTQMSVWISADSLTANGSDCRIFLTNASLKVESTVNNVWLPAAEGSYKSELEVFRTNLSRRWAELAEEAEKKINNASDPRYAELRRVYAAIAMAQWYKKQNRQNAVFSDLIDSYNITGLDIGFNKAYYENLAVQHMYTFTYPSPDYYYYEVYGGVVLSNTDTTVVDDIDNGTSAKIGNASVLSYVKEGNEYLYSTLIDAEGVNLNPLAIGFSSLDPTLNETVNVSIAIDNEGDIGSDNFTVYFYQTFIYLDGTTVNQKISEVNASGIAANSIVLINTTWNTPSAIGDYNITAVVDYKKQVKENNELDNTVTGTPQVHSQYPTATILSPSANSKSCGTTNLIGSGTDFQDGWLNESRFNWTSSKDGYLGNSSSVSKNLTLGVHTISFSIVDSDGFTDKASINLNVITCSNPVPIIISPLNTTFAEGEDVYFVGNALDEEDGTIPNSSLSWISSIDGLLASGSSFSKKTLLAGSHQITFKAVDETSLEGYDYVNITVNEGKPNISIISPYNGQVFIHKAAVSFNVSSQDAQDGDLTSSVLWTSSIDGNIGTGNFSSNLTIGNHNITATIIDSNGLMNRSSLLIRVEPPHYPEISIISPKEGQSFVHGDNITFKAVYTDFEDGTIPNSSVVWNSTIDGWIGNGTELVKYNFSIGNHTVSFYVNDSDNMRTITDVRITVNPARPKPVITTPSNGAIFGQTDIIILNSSVTDYEDGILSGNSLNWTSDKNGFLGNGTLLNATNLSVGTHLITLNAKDSSGLTATTSINIIIVGLTKKLVNMFSDGTTAKNITFTISGNKTEYLALLKTANITYSAITIKGYSP